MGVGDHDNQVYVIDFSLAKRYRDLKTRLHIPYKANCKLTGTTPYASINNHLSIEQSHCDDLEFIAYVLLYFLCGSLPWLAAEPAINKQPHDTILQRKRNTPLDILCSTCPIEFSIFLNYTHTLHFKEKPDYSYIHSLFHSLFVCEGYHDQPVVGCMTGNDQNAVVRVRVEQENGTCHTSSRMYVLRSSMLTHLIAAFLACALVLIVTMSTSSLF